MTDKEIYQKLIKLTSELMEMKANYALSIKTDNVGYASAMNEIRTLEDIHTKFKLFSR